VQDLSTNTLKTRRNALSLLCKYQGKGLPYAIDEDPVPSVRKFTPLTSVTKMIGVSGMKKEKIVVCMSGFFGLRLKEIRRLRLSDLTFEGSSQDVLKVSIVIPDFQKSQAFPRVVRLRSPKLCVLVKNYLASDLPNPIVTTLISNWMFPGRDPHHTVVTSTLQRWLVKIARVAGVEATHRSLRNTAILFLRYGMSGKEDHLKPAAIAHKLSINKREVLKILKAGYFSVFTGDPVSDLDSHLVID